jgi:wobble nucleotide-excising tRNase
MIKLLQFIGNVGQFEAVSAPQIPLAPVTLIYAENGRGKTTIAAVLRSLATGNPIPITERRRLGVDDPPCVVIDCDGGPRPAVFANGVWNRTVPNLAVFDDVFVDQNVCSGLMVDAEHRQNLHEWILGSQGVTLNRTLQECVARIEELNRVLRAAADAIPSGVRGNLNADDFCALQPRSDIDVGIREAERALSAAEQQETIRGAAGFGAVFLPDFEIDEIERTLAMGLEELDGEAGDQVQKHFRPMGPDGEAWVGEGMKWVRPEENGDCPFCGQQLAESSLINHYRAYFSTAYKNLKQHIADVTSEFIGLNGGDAPAAFERSIRVLAERRQFWSNFALLPEVDLDTAAIGNVWGSARDAVLNALQRKQSAPLEAMTFSEDERALIRAYEAGRDRVRRLNTSFQAANEAVALIKERAAAGDRTALIRDVAMLKSLKARYTPEIDALCVNFLTEKNAKARAERERDEARAALDNYREQVFPNYEAAINVYLQRFNAGFRLEQVVSVNTRNGSSCTYSVLIGDHAVMVGGPQPPPGTPSFRTSLSAGDRNTLALAFFFASLDRDVALRDKIVVIDDPITSLDDHRSLSTVQEMRRLSQNIRQLIALSHNKGFLCNVWEGTDTNTRLAIEVVRQGEGSTIQLWDVTRDCITEHDRRHELLRSYLTGPANNGREVAQSLRPVLESFIRVAYPEHCPPGTVLGRFRRRCERRVGTAEQILTQPNIDELGDLTEYANRFHHDTNPAWQTAHINDGELLGFVRRTLAFATRS